MIIVWKMMFYPKIWFKNPQSRRCFRTQFMAHRFNLMVSLSLAYFRNAGHPHLEVVEETILALQSDRDQDVAFFATLEPKRGNLVHTTMLEKQNWALGPLTIAPFVLGAHLLCNQTCWGREASETLTPHSQMTPFPHAVMGLYLGPACAVLLPPTYLIQGLKGPRTRWLTGSGGLHSLRLLISSLFSLW